MKSRNTKKQPADTTEADDDLDIPPTTREFFKRGKVGKYYAEIMSDCNVVRIGSDLRKAFPNEQSVNQALRELLKMRETLLSITAGKVKRKKSA
jgi:hypothetical protein